MCTDYVVAFLTGNRIRVKQLRCKFRLTKRVHVFAWIPENYVAWLIKICDLIP